MTLQSFHAHLLIGLDKDENLKSLSFSSYNEIETMYSLNFNKKMHITFNSGDIFYNTTEKVNSKTLKNLTKSILNLYFHPHCQADKSNGEEVGMRDPEVLLKELSQCAKTHTTIIKATSDRIEDLAQIMPLFLDTLTSAFNEELTRINENKGIYYSTPSKR